VKTAAGLVKVGMWQRMRTGSAAKGARDYHWAMIEIMPDDTPEGHDDGHVAVARWRIEEDHQLAKQAAGLESGQVTTWTSWHR
jgi:hypothetical protein